MNGTYRFRDGSNVRYRSQVVLEFLQYADRFLHIAGSEFQSPSPNSYRFDDGRVLTPDLYVPSRNLEIELTSGGGQYSEGLESVLSVNNISITGKDYKDFTDKWLHGDFGDPDDQEFVAMANEFFSGIRNALRGYDFIGESIAIEAAGYSSSSKYPVFIILTSGSTPLAKLITKATGDQFSHSSISFDI